MTIHKQDDLLINTITIGYEGKVKTQAGSITRNVFSQVNGSKIITSDVSTNVSIIRIPIRSTTENRKLFESFYHNGDNNTISFGEQNFSGCVMEVLPELENLELGEYVFKGDPAI